MTAYVRTKIFIALLGMIAVVLGYNYFFQPFAYLAQPIPLSPQLTATPQPATQPMVATASATYDAAAAVAALTPRARVALLFAAPLHVTPIDQAMVQFVAQNQPGIVTLFGSEISSQSARLAIGMTQQATAGASMRAPLVAVDHEGGSVARLSGEGFLRLPSWQVLCAMNEPNRQMALQQTAQELKNVGITMVLGPVLDVGGADSALGDRICAAEPTVVSAMSQSFITAFRNVGILPVVKHFPGIGSLKKDLHTTFAATATTEQELYVFKTVLGANPSIGVMVSPMGVSNQSAQLPCMVSRDCVGQLVSTYPAALVVSDGIEMTAARYNAADPSRPKTLTQTSLEALLAGVDVLLFGDGVRAAELDAILTNLTVEYGRSASVSARVDASAGKVLQLIHQANPGTMDKAQ